MPSPSATPSGSAAAPACNVGRVLASPEFWVLAGPDGTVHEVGQADPEWSRMGATCQGQVDVGLCVTAEQVNEAFTVHGNWPDDDQVTIER